MFMNDLFANENNNNNIPAYLFFDTETTGLPRNWKAPVTDVDNWPRLVQLAFILYDEYGHCLGTGNFIVKPEGFTIPLEASNVHGINTARALSEGQDLNWVLDEFNRHLDQCITIVAHNISFDEKIIGAEFIRKSIPNKLHKKKRVCTMQSTINLCQLPGKYGWKYPSLQELHKKLFGENFEDAHDAFADIQATAKCFWELKRKNYQGWKS